jgi:hypothetical protein
MGSARVKRVARATSWRRIEEDIRLDVQAGVMKPNDRLRSQEDLAAEYGIGLHGVRLAIQSLKGAGFLYSRPKSGVYVAPPGGAAPGRAPGGNGLHVFDIVSRADRELTFVIAGWHDGNRAMWERICRDASHEIPGVRVTPLFPANPTEYDAAIRRCDVFTSTPWDRKLFRGQRGLIEPIHPSEFRDLPLAEAHIRPVMLGGNAVGLPFFGTLFFGAIHPSLPAVTQRLLADAESWTELMPRLEKVRADHPRLNGVNLHWWCVMNLYQHLRHVGGELVSEKEEIQIGRADFREALESVEKHRGRAFPAGAGAASQVDPTLCCTCVVGTYTFPRRPELADFIPWLFPVGRHGSYQEGMGMGVISGTTPYPDECRQLLRHLLSDRAQGALAATPGEHPLSLNVRDRFAGYPAKWKRLLNEVKERSTISNDVTPGYHEFMDGAFFPLAERFFRGELGAGDFVKQFKERGRRFFARGYRAVWPGAREAAPRGEREAVAV